MVHREGYFLSLRMRTIFVTVGLLVLGIFSVSFLNGGLMRVLSEEFNVHAPRPILSVLISISDGQSIYTINGAPAFTFKDDSAFSPPKGDNDYMKSYSLEGATLVRLSVMWSYYDASLTTAQVSNANINGTFSHVVNGIGLPLYTQVSIDLINLSLLNTLNDYYAPAFATSNVHDYSSRLPALGSSWLYQPFMNGTMPFDASADVAVYDVDLRDVTKQQISALKGAGSVVICRILAGAALQHHSGSAHVQVGQSILPKSVSQGAVPGKSGEVFINFGLPDVKHAIEILIERAASFGCDGAEYMRTQFTSFQSVAVDEPEQLAFHQWLTQTARTKGMFSVLRNEGSLTPSYGSTYDALVQQNMFLVQSDELASIFSSQNKPVFNVENVEKYGLGAIPECSGRINVLLNCVKSILSKFKVLKYSNKNICEESLDLHVSTIFRTLSARGNADVVTCSSSLISLTGSTSDTVASHSGVAVKSLVPSRNIPDGMGGIQGSGWFSGARLVTFNCLVPLLVALLCLSFL